MTFVIVATEENKDSVINMLVASHNEIWYHRTFHYVPTPRIMKYTGHSEHSITYQHRELWNIPDIQNIPLRTNTENYEIYRTFRTFHYVPTPRIMKSTGHSEHSITCQHRELWNIPDIQNIPLRANTENYEIYRTFWIWIWPENVFEIQHKEQFGYHMGKKPVAPAGDIKGFCRDVGEICALLVHNEACGPNILPTFWENLSALSWPL